MTLNRDGRRPEPQKRTTPGPYAPQREWLLHAAKAKEVDISRVPAILLARFGSEASAVALEQADALRSKEMARAFNTGFASLMSATNRRQAPRQTRLEIP